MCTANMSKCLGKVKKSWLFPSLNRLTVTTVNLHFFLEPRERRDVGAFVGFQEAKHLQAEKKKRVKKHLHFFRQKKEQKLEKKKAPKQSEKMKIIKSWRTWKKHMKKKKQTMNKWFFSCDVIMILVWTF